MKYPRSRHYVSIWLNKKVKCNQVMCKLCNISHKGITIKWFITVEQGFYFMFERK